MRKNKKVSTFEQVIQASAVVDAKYSSYEKATQRYSALVANFSECKNKLFEFEGKKYVVTCQKWPYIFNVTEVKT